MNGRALRASINQAEVGTLQEVAGLWSFQYAADFHAWPIWPARAESGREEPNARHPAS